MALEREEIYSGVLLSGVLSKYDYLEQGEKAFIKRLFEGTTEQRIYLDYCIDRFSKTPVRKMKPLIRSLVRMSAYQIFFMDNVPDAAAVNEAVKICRKRSFGNLSGFVNAVLRNLSRGKADIPLPDEQKDPAFFLSVRYSVPRWMAEYFLGLYGVEGAERLLGALLEVHPVSIRVRTDATEEQISRFLADAERAGVQLKQSSIFDHIYLAEHLEGVASLPGYEEGLFTVQDASSALAVSAAGIRPGDLVVDACAAPGGKSLLACELTGPDGRVISRDRSEDKCDRILENAQRMGAQQLEAQVFDATESDPALQGKADVLILDVPCSGLGVLGKKRDIKYRITPESMEEVARLQEQIVDASWEMVRPGGILLYSTCTIGPRENEDQVRRILEKYPFEAVTEGRQFLPGTDPCDGFFYQVLRRKG